MFHQSIYFVKSDFITPKTIENRCRNVNVMDCGLWQILSFSQNHCDVENWISHSNDSFAFWRTYAFSKLDLDCAHVFQNAKKLLCQYLHDYILFVCLLNVQYCMFKNMHIITLPSHANRIRQACNYGLIYLSLFIKSSFSFSLLLLLSVILFHSLFLKRP